MSKLILINSTPEEVRVALVENDVLAEMHIERARDRGIVGNIYKGKVVRVLPGMQAAFVDVGLAKAGFLHVSDFHPGVADLPLIDPELLERELDDEPAGEDASASTLDQLDTVITADEEPSAPPPPVDPIETRLARGDEILVQVAKEPLGSKGARITSWVSCSG
jgi:ribonuclease G